MPALSDLELLTTAAREAGDVAKPFWQADPQKWEKPDGQGPVTEADLAVNELLEKTLRAARPDYGWLSEESVDDAARLSAEFVFIIDPIDGTRSFIDGKEYWAHSLAIARNGVIETAAVYVPVKDLMYTAARGQGAFLNGAPLSVASEKPGEPLSVLAAAPVMDDKHWKGGRPPFERAFRPSLAYRLALVAEGAFDAMVTVRRTWEWDVAAGDLLVEEAGGEVRDTTGAQARYNNPDPRLNGMVASRPAFCQKLLRGLTG